MGSPTSSHTRQTSKPSPTASASEKLHAASVTKDPSPCPSTTVTHVTTQTLTSVKRVTIVACTAMTMNMFWWSWERLGVGLWRGGIILALRAPRGKGMLLICEIFRGMEAFERFVEGWEGKEYRITSHCSQLEGMGAFTLAWNMTSTSHTQSNSYHMRLKAGQSHAIVSPVTVQARYVSVTIPMSVSAKCTPRGPNH